MALSFKKHLLAAGLLLVLALAWIGVRNWDAIAVMVDNAAALNEGGEAAADIRSPDDLVAYLAEHPETVSLAVYDVGRRGEGLFLRADTPRAVPSLPKLQVAAEYHRRVHAGETDPEEPVAIDSVGVFSLPGITADGHRRALDTLAARGQVAPDSTVARRHWVDAALNLGDAAALDWILTAWGRETVRALPARAGLTDSDPPLPVTGRYLAWTESTATAAAEAAAPGIRGTGADGRTAPPPGAAADAFSADAFFDDAFRWAHRLRTDAAFRGRVRDRLRAEGTGLRLRDQADLASDGFPTATARDYASWLARIAGSRFPPVERFRADWERPLTADTAQTAFTHLASRSGAYPGLLAVAGYARRSGDAPPRVAVLLIEDLPLAVLYHLLQTGIHKGLQLQLLAEAAYADRVRSAFASASPPVAATSRPAPVARSR
jgi:hypothetical protein